MARAAWLTAESRVVLFSSVGSLPLHLTAVLAATAGSAGGIGGVAPGVLTGAALLGLFASSGTRSSGLLDSIWRVRWLAPLRPVMGHPAATILPQLLLLAALPFVTGTLALAGWFAVGWISGIYMFTGMVAAASGVSKFFGFMARLSAAMVLAGVIALAVQWTHFGEPYMRLCLFYALVVLVVALILRPDRRIVTAAPSLRADIPSRYGEQLVALFGLLGFFLAAMMFVSNMNAFLNPPGSLFDRTAGSVGVSKIAAGAILTVTVALWRRDSTVRFVVTAIGLIATMILLDGAEGLAISLSILVAFEITLNVGGSAAMAEVARVGNPFIKRMIPTVGLAGVAAGPMVGAAILSLGSAGWVRWFAVLLMGLSVVAILAVHRVAIRRRRRRSAAGLANPGHDSTLALSAAG